MASIKEAGGERVVCRQPASSGSAGVEDTRDIGREVEEYLTSVRLELSSNPNPRLKAEESRLLDLLESYRKLNQLYEKNKDFKESLINGLKRDNKLSEIYSVLYPGLYENRAEREKDKLRKTLIKGKTPSDLCVPKNVRIQSSRGQDLQDTRQKEKERFVRLVSSAPSAFLQGPPRKYTASRRALLTSSASARPPQKREDVREKEKERLARILSADYEANPSNRKRSTVSNPQLKKQIASNKSNTAVKRDATNKNQTTHKPNRPLSNAEGGMVKRDVGVLSRKVGSNTNQDRKKKLLDLNCREHQEYLDKLQGKHVPTMDKAVLAREASILDLTDDGVQYSPRSMVSVATQTDEPAIFSPTRPLTPAMNTESMIEQSKLFPVQKEAFITSPRAKLIKDLHGVSPCLPGASPLLTLPDQASCDERKKRTAYAEALKAQIDEKRRLEEEKRRKELEEDEYIEKKAKEQQERLKEEWEREQSLRQDWLMQKEAQEETVRQRMAELELEAKELKRRERLRKGRPLSPAVAQTPSLHRARMSPREVEQLLPQAMRDSMISSIIADKPRPKSLLLENNNNNILLSNENVEGSVGTPASDDERTQFRDKDDKTTAGNASKDAGRPSSPVLPAVQTDSILRRSVYASPRLELIKGDNDKDELLRGDKILTQLGVFRRELELEQERLQQRLQEQAQT